MSASNTNNLARKPLASRGTINRQEARKEILLSLAIIFVPNLIFTAILLGLVSHYQVPPTYFELPGVPEPVVRESSAYLINFSATKLLTVASWTSTLSSLLPSFVMVLVSYPVACTLLDASKDKKTDNLPTPYQLSMLLGTLNGTFGSLWNWLMYLIIIADTWLHATTSTIQIWQAVPGIPSVSTFGRGFASGDCVTITETYTNPCSVSVGEHGPYFIYGAAESFATLANDSSQNSLLLFQYKGKSYALITDANIPQETSYQARTFAVTTQCTLIDDKCGLISGAASTVYNCSEEFSGYLPAAPDLINPSWALAGVRFFQDPGLSQTFPYRGGEFNFTSTNPVYMGAYGAILGWNTESSLYNSSGGLDLTRTQDLAFVLGCNVTAYDLEYVWYNGSVLVQQMVQSNGSVLRSFTAPFVSELANMMNLAQSAAGQSTPSGFVESWATGFSTMALGLSASSFSPRETIKEQVRVSTLVARVPKAPLAVLVFLTLLYAVIGILLAYIAVKAGTDETKSVQSRLSVAGLAAKCFEGEDICERPKKEIYELFAENEVGARDQRCPKVSIVASRRGGWKYELMEKDEQSNAVFVDLAGNKTAQTYIQPLHNDFGV
ncbi:hypothetical protein L207DRAFT_588563 [Hyaloscypha variabilis F]|uniref:Uncharacterized protein n=1 Tax=Hyaloscypha variabilis (strain UAMH 11265 / GT02V1 / F) TaxID=1149755 RepID=A0A2J6R963_HYAVF|nr:hypothetical protein L207DRAFT_588563 [Hyaloscypha variabilis F]